MNLDERLRTMRAWPSRGRARSQFDRARRLTFLMLMIGAVVAWVGPVGSLVLAAGPVADPDGEVTLTVPHLVAELAGLTAFTVLYVRAVLAAVAGRPARGAVVASGLIMLALLAIQGDTEVWSWVFLGPLWAGVAVLGMSTSANVLTCLATIVACSAVAAKGVPDAGRLVIIGAGCLLFSWANRFQLWFWEVLRAAEEGKQAQARLAVTEERLRFARDLHDLVGHSLSAIAVKSEVATRLATADGPRAAAEMTEVRTLARKALREIRTAVRGYRTVDLAAELRSARAVLEAGGVRCALETAPDGLPQDVRTLLAWVVREGTTNVLRHSRASRCRISLTVSAGRAVLEMCNDGAGSRSSPEAVPGTDDGTDDGMAGDDRTPGIGLAGLAERVASLGGVLRAGPGEPGRFVLSAAVPVRDAT